MTIDPIELYAAAIDTSDFVAQVAPLIRQRTPAIGDLLDIGAGGGQLGWALREPGRRWTAVEPSPAMRRRLARFAAAVHIVNSPWQALAIEPRSYDTVLAANISALLEQPQEFLDRCHAWGRGTIIWVVPAQHGPHGLVFGGCLPATWHGEDETPGVEIVLRRLPHRDRPHAVAITAWTFSAVVTDLAVLAGYLADRLSWRGSDSRRQDLLNHLTRQAKPDAAGCRLEIPRRSAVLMWRIAL